MKTQDATPFEDKTDCKIKFGSPPQFVGIHSFTQTEQTTKIRLTNGDSMQTQLLTKRLINFSPTPQKIAETTHTHREDQHILTR